MYHNYRNESVKLKAHLIQACRHLEQYGIEMDSKLAAWWRAQKTLALIRKQKGSDFGVLQTTIANEEAQ